MQKREEILSSERESCHGRENTGASSAADDWGDLDLSWSNEPFVNYSLLKQIVTASSLSLEQVNEVLKKAVVARIPGLSLGLEVAENTKWFGSLEELPAIMASFTVAGELPASFCQGPSLPVDIDTRLLVEFVKAIRGNSIGVVAVTGNQGPTLYYNSKQLQSFDDFYK